jgi:hypothetical protein
LSGGRFASLSGFVCLIFSDQTLFADYASFHLLWDSSATIIA